MLDTGWMAWKLDGSLPLVQFSKPLVMLSRIRPTNGQGGLSPKAHKQPSRVTFPSSSLCSFWFPRVLFLLLWQKSGVLVTSFAAHFIQLHLAPMPGRGQTRKLQNYSNWRERFILLEFYVCVGPDCCCEVYPCWTVWVLGYERKEKRKQRFPLLFLSGSNPLSCSSQNQRASL